jgi:MSHA biogenesis protein MshG
MRHAKITSRRMSATEFHYKALDTNGRAHAGSILASDQQDAHARLIAQGLTPVRLRRAAAARSSTSRINREHIAGFTRELQVLVQARIPLAKGLRAIADADAKAPAADIVRDIAVAIESGSAVSDAFESKRHIFGDIYVQALRAAERTGTLAQVLGHLADLLDKEIESRQALRRALAYPVMLLGVVFSALATILIFVVPKFSATFEANGVKLPIITRVIQALGHSAANFWYLYLLAALAIFASAFVFCSSTRGRAAIERFLLTLPAVGPTITADATARFIRVFGISLGAGMDITDAIELGGKSTGRAIFSAECARIASSMRAGERFEDAVRNVVSLPPFASRLLSAGKDAHEIAGTCSVIGAFYERDAAHRTKTITTIMQPVITVILAGIVLLVALSVFLPMWEMVRINR